MIVDDTADVEQRAWFQLTHFPHELVGLFGIGSATLLVRVEPVGRIERVFQVLFKLIDRANPFLYAFGGMASALLRMSATNSSLHCAAPPL